MLLVVLLALPALPLPTGGVTHVFEAAAMLLSLELVLGRRELWVPQRWRDRELRGMTNERFRRALVRRIRWFERFARPRWTPLVTAPVARRVYGAVTLGLSLCAFLAPPFTGLDTLPALGVVVLSLGVLFSDALIAAIGLVIGAAGVAVVVGLGHVIVRLL